MWCDVVRVLVSVEEKYRMQEARGSLRTKNLNLTRSSQISSQVNELYAFYWSMEKHLAKRRPTDNLTANFSSVTESSKFELAILIMVCSHMIQTTGSYGNRLC